MAERESRARSKTAGDGAACGGKMRLGDNHLDSLAPSSEDPGMNPASFSCFALIYDDLRQPSPAPGIVVIGTAVSNSSQCAVP